MAWNRQESKRVTGRSPGKLSGMHLSRGTSSRVGRQAGVSGAEQAVEQAGRKMSRLPGRRPGSLSGRVLGGVSVVEQADC